MDSKGYPHPQPPPQYGIPAQYGQGGYPQPPYDQGYAQPQPVIVEQQQVHVVMAPNVGPDPTMITCPSCRSQVVTRMEFESTTKTHICAGLLCLFGCWPCVCVPYCVDSCRNGNHYCPSCGAFIGTYQN